MNEVMTYLGWYAFGALFGFTLGVITTCFLAFMYSRWLEKQAIKACALMKTRADKEGKAVEETETVTEMVTETVTETVQ